MSSTIGNPAAAGGAALTGVLTAGYNGGTIGGAAPDTLAATLGGSFDADILPLPAAAATVGDHYFGDYYNRIWLIPAAISFNAISGETQQNFSLWNAYTSSKTLSSIGQTETEGLDLGAPLLPRTLNALELLPFTLTATLDGPPTIAASYSFTFSNAEDPVLPVSGTRSKLWPFPVNWNDSYNVILEYRTEIITSRSGREQRRALRTTPRKSIEFSSVVDGDKFRAFKRLLASWQNKSMLMPEVTRTARTSAAMAIGSNAVTVESVPSWLVAGATVVLVAGETMALRDVQSVAGSTVAFTAVAGETWPVGTKIHPALGGLLDAEISGSTPINSAATVQVRFDVTPASEPLVAVPAAPAMLDGRELLTRKPNWGDSVSISYNYSRDTVDYGRGRISTFRPVEFGHQIRRGVFVGNPASDAEALADFFRRMKGQRGEFYVSSGEPDLVLNSSVAAGNFDLRVAGQDVLGAYGDDTVHRAVSIRLADGSRFHSTIDLMFADAGDTVIRLDTAVPATLVPNEVVVSWLYLARHATDRLTVEWITDETARIAMSFLTLENLPAESNP